MLCLCDREVSCEFVSREVKRNYQYHCTRTLATVKPYGTGLLVFFLLLSAPSRPLRFILSSLYTVSLYAIGESLGSDS